LKEWRSSRGDADCRLFGGALAGDPNSGEHMDNRFEPGADRSKLSKQLGDNMLRDLVSDWNREGAVAIAKAREDRPMDYLKLIAAALPKDFASAIEANELEELSEEQLERQLSNLLASLEEAGDTGCAHTGAKEAS
jgi:hypothetical protein